MHPYIYLPIYLPICLSIHPSKKESRHLGESWGHVAYVGASWIKIKDATLSNAAVDTLAKLVADDTSMRGSNWAKAFAPEKQETAFDPQAWAQRMVKSNGADQLEAMIAALQAQRSPVKKAA